MAYSVSQFSLNITKCLKQITHEEMVFIHLHLGSCKSKQHYAHAEKLLI